MNTLALSTDYVLRTGCFDHKQKFVYSDDDDDTRAKMRAYALERYQKARDVNGEMLVSGSDDFTMFMWQPKKSNKSLARLSGH